MKPNFALTLSEDAIGLLHRSKGGWNRLGEVSLDDPGLAETLALMRRTAEGLSEGLLTTKLVIPDSQVRYATLPAAGQSPAERRASLRRGLDGLTPYSVDELVFDWHADGDSARLAIVARETLDEAERFARGHAFNPVCFVAAPREADFDGEAFFGPTALAGELLPKGTKPEADSQAVRAGGMADYADSSAAEPRKPRRKPRKTPEAPSAGAGQHSGEPPTARPSGARARSGGAEVGLPTAPEDARTSPQAGGSPADGDSGPAAPGGLAARETATGQPEAETAENRPEPAAFASRRRAEGDLPMPPPEDAGARAAPPARLTLAEPDAHPPAEEDGAARPAELAASAAPDEAPQHPMETAPNRIGSTSPAGSQGPAEDAPHRAPAQDRTIRAQPATAGRVGRIEPPAMSRNGSTALRVPPALKAFVPGESGAETGGAPARPVSGGAAGSPEEGVPLRPDPAERPFRTHYIETPLDRGEPDIAPAPVPDAEVARGAAPRRFSVGLGIMLTAGLLAVMGAVALWSMMTPGGGGLTDQGAVPQIAEDPAATAPSASPDTEIAGAGAEAGGGQAGDGTASEGVSSADPWRGLPERLDAPPQDRIETLYIAALDPSIRPPQNVSLPDPRRFRAGDEALARQSDPPGPDDVFAVDDRGLVTATPEGAVTPDGLVVYAGQPDLTPPERPEDLAPPPATAPAPEAAGTPAPEAAPPSAPAETVIVTAGRPSVTPPPRPAGLAPDVSDAPAPASQASDAGPEAPATDADPAPPAEIEVTVRRGRPEIVPPARPDERAPAPAANSGESTAVQETAAPTAEQESSLGAPLADAVDQVALAAIRPEPEPSAADPLPEAAARRDPALPETAMLASDPETAARLAAFRPRIRPAGLTPAALPVPQPEPTIRPRSRPAGLAPEQAAPATSPADGPGQTVAEDVAAAVAEAIADGEQEAEPELSDIALSASIRPAARPSDFSDKVTSTAPAVPASAAATPPRTPTNTSVAKQATVKNAINLGAVNLIGVYGSPNDRRALVRLPTGRYLKVKVGDRIDGGQVAAIGDDQLRYVKNGRNVVLDLPGG